ncbi:MAG: hypothetical protein WDN24_14080 [Sphingomonas sp.]
MRSLLLAALVNALVSLGLFAAAEVILVVTKAGNIDWMIVQLFILLPIALAVGAGGDGGDQPGRGAGRDRCWPDRIWRRTCWR